MNKDTQKNLLIIVLVIGILIWAWFALVSSKSVDNPTDPGTADTTEEADQNTNDLTASSSATTTMDLVVYLQDKEEMITNDCGITYAKTIQVPKTKAVADASLRYLFSDELAQYGEYQSVRINNGVAEVTLEKDQDPTGRNIASLSSCEARHLFSVLLDTLTQYDTINSVELYSPSGKIEF